jgi:hypothetical protein
MLERRAETVAASEQLKKRTVSEQESLRGKCVDLLLQGRVLVAEPIYSGARVERPDQATRKRRNEDECDCGGSGDREAIAKPSRQEE